MDKIKNIDYDNQYIKIESSNKYIYKIPNNNKYVKELLNKGIHTSKDLNKDIKYYNKCADICVLPVWIAAAFLTYGFITDFILFDFVLVVSGLMSGVSLIGTTVFKVASKKLNNDAINNQYFTALFEYAKSGGKQNNKTSDKIKQNINSNSRTQKETHFSQKNFGTTEKNKVSNQQQNTYHFHKSQIIQDEVVQQRKR